MALTRNLADLDSRSIFSYSSKPTTDSEWYRFYQNNYTTITFSATAYSIDGSDGSSTAVSARMGYVGFRNSGNTGVDAYFVFWTSSTSGCGPHCFTGTSRTSTAPAYEISGSGFGALAVWSVGSFTDSNKATNQQKNTIYVVSSVTGSDYNDKWMDDSITVTSTVIDRIHSLCSYDGCNWRGCVQANISITLPTGTLTLGTSTYSITCGITNGGNVRAYDLLVGIENEEGYAIQFANSTSSGTLPHSLEKLYPNAKTSESLKFFGRFQAQVWEPNERTYLVPPVYVNNEMVTNLASQALTYQATPVTRTVQISSSRTPTCSAGTGVKTDNHNSKLVMLPNNYDTLAVAATFTDQSYYYQDVQSLDDVTLALYVGDSNVGTYQPSSNSGNTYTYNFTYGPLSVIPPITQGNDYQIKAKFQDRFGRAYTKTLTLTCESTSISYLRFYNYVKPTFTVSGQRVNSSGTPDENEGTRIKVTYSWSLNLLDLSKSTHTGTTTPTLVITNNQDSTTNSYNLSTATGSSNYTLTSCPIDKTYTFTAVLTDACGRSYTQTFYVASGSVFMDFKSGGKALGIGMRAETNNLLQIGWNTKIFGNMESTGQVKSSTLLTTTGTITTGTITTLNVTNSINGPIAASKATFDPTNTTLSSTNVQAAIVELAGQISSISVPGMQTGISLDDDSHLWRWVYYPDADNPGTNSLAWMQMSLSQDLSIALSTIRGTPVTFNYHLPTYFFTYDGDSGNFPYYFTITRSDDPSGNSQYRCPLEWTITPTISSIGSTGVQAIKAFKVYVWTSGMSTYSGTAKLHLSAEGLGLRSLL